jgi:uncharacterized membrane protein YcjF (UPF0283 family)
MARVSLQVKNIASLVLAAAASIASAVTVRRFFERGNWVIPAACLAISLGCQLLLLFVESKEEEELSLLRMRRMNRSRHAAEELARITLRIQNEIDHGTVELAEQWHRFREKIDD